MIPLRRSNSGNAPLFCLLGIALYRPLALALQTDRPVYGVHVPYVLSQTSFRPSAIAEIAGQYVQAIRSVSPHGPYHLSGLCFGGVVAFEVAQQLQAQGETVETIMLFDTTLPRGVRIRREQQMVHWARQLFRTPQRLRDFWATSRANAIASLRMQVAATLGERVPEFVRVGDETELNVLSPEAVQVVRRYQRIMRPVGARSLLFRAQASGTPPGDFWTKTWAGPISRRSSRPWT